MPLSYELCSKYRVYYCFNFTLNELSFAMYGEGGTIDIILNGGKGWLHDIYLTPATGIKIDQARFWTLFA